MAPPKKVTLIALEDRIKASEDKTQLLIARVASLEALVAHITWRKLHRAGY